MNVVYLVFLGLAWVGIECLIGGTRLLYSLPAYGVLSIGAILTLASLFKKQRIPPDAWCVGTTLALGGWILIRALHSPVEYLAWPDFFMMLGCLMTYLLTVFYLTGIGERTALIAVLWGIAAMEVWVGMVQFIHDPNYMLFGLLRPAIARASGMYISPNNLAGFLAMVAIVSLSLGVWSRWPVWAKLLAFYVTGYCTIGVAISGSRGGYFDLIGSLLCFAIISIYTIRVADPKKFVPVLVGALGGLLATVALAVFLMAHSQLLTHRMETMAVREVRIYNWEAAVDHIRVSPWTGTGSGTHLIFGRLFRRPEIQVDPVHAHCDYLELLAEYGILGGLGMALFLAAHIRRGSISFSEILRRRLIPSGLHRSNNFGLQVGALCAIAGLAIHSVVDFDMHIPGNALAFAFLFGLLANPGMERRPDFVDGHVTPWAKILLPVFGAVVLWLGMPMLPAEYCSEMARRSLRNQDFWDAIHFAKQGLTPVALPADGLDPDGLPRKKTDVLDWLLSKTGPELRNPNLFFYLGEANRGVANGMHNQFMRGRYFEQAASAFESGLRVFPQDESMLVRYGQVLDGMRRYDDAEVIYQRALAWDPNLAMLHDYYENHLAAEGKAMEAAEIEKKWRETKVIEVDTGSKEDYRLQ